MNNINENGWKSYNQLLETSIDEVHFGVGIPGNSELNLIKIVKNNELALDIGCGSGENIIALTKLGYKCTGIDPSLKQIEMANELCDVNNVVAKLSKMPAEDIDKLEESYSLILSIGVLHFCEDFPALVMKIRDRIIPGGNIVISLPHPLDMVCDFKKGETQAKIEVNSYFPENKKIIGARYWRRFGGIHNMSENLEEYVNTVGDCINALLNAGLHITKVLELPSSHQSRQPCTFIQTDEVFKYDYSLRVPQYLILMATAPL